MKNLLYFALLSFCCTPTAHFEPRQILIITGGHDFEHAAFFRMFDEFGDIIWKEKIHPLEQGVFSAGEQPFEVVLFYDMPDSISAAVQEELTQLLQRGTGVVFLHHALCANPGWPEYERMVGGKYLPAAVERAGRMLPASTYREDVEVKVEIADRRHPVTRGLGDFILHDEVYGGFITRPDIHPLLRTNHPESSPVIGWAHTYGRSRIVYLQPGHDHRAFEDPRFRRLLRNAIEWVSDTGSLDVNPG
ncbi:MAG TPA: ThuA domain-containing protein [bacterium]|nr:ThuA domain-containing protein [bacterium]HQI47371.1 ThuA domain-containing protein [bacterium]HQJ63027.1 ThuA domain-containing protein [bacterium]